MILNKNKQMDGSMLSYCLFDTPMGVCGIAWKDSERTGGQPVVISLQLPEATEQLTEERIAGMADDNRVSPPPSYIAEIVEKIRRHLSGESQDFRDISIGYDGLGSFSQQVYQVCRDIPAGSTMSYGELAAAINRPGAARAVGHALGRNPVPLLIPCHRVLTAMGKAGGFSAYGGVKTKARILALEGVII
jgi:O-6-methylguanine DNA methyltransferase